MQKAKDTFLNHLMTRLSEIDSSRTATIDGVTRPAVMACENERAELAGGLENTFSIEWQDSAQRYCEAGVQTMTCTISYWTCGSSSMSGVDRGRSIGAMDDLLRSMLSDRKTIKLDFSVSPAVELGSNVFWGEPKFAAVEEKSLRLCRTAKVDVHYFLEEGR